MIVLDTHVLIWWVNGDPQLTDNQLNSIEYHRLKELPVAVSAISLWEIAMLVRAKRLVLRGGLDQWLGWVRMTGIREIPVDGEIAVRSVELPDWEHKDPADRLIVATAAVHGADLLTSDGKIREYLGRTHLVNVIT